MCLCQFTHLIGRIEFGPTCSRDLMSSVVLHLQLGKHFEQVCRQIICLNNSTSNNYQSWQTGTLFAQGEFPPTCADLDLRMCVAIYMKY